MKGKNMPTYDVLLTICAKHYHKVSAADALEAAKLIQILKTELKKNDDDIIAIDHEYIEEENNYDGN